MRLAVIGASGRTGRAVVEAALGAGHVVIAVVRDASRLAVTVDEIRIADATDVSPLATAIAGSDAVVWCVGPGRDTVADIMERSIRATIAAMDTAGVRRLVAISATGPYTEGDPWMLRRVVKPILWRFLGTVWRDMEKTEIVIRASDTDWTIMRPPQLTDRPARGYRSRRDLNVGNGFRVARADLAAAMVDALADDTTVRHAVSVAN